MAALPDGSYHNSFSGATILAYSLPLQCTKQKHCKIWQKENVMSETGQNQFPFLVPLPVPFLFFLLFFFFAHFLGRNRSARPPTRSSGPARRCDRNTQMSGLASPRLRHPSPPPSAWFVKDRNCLSCNGKRGAARLVPWRPLHLRPTFAAHSVEQRDRRE